MRAPRLTSARLLAAAPVFACLGDPAGAEDAASSRFKNRLYFYSGLDVASDNAYGWAGVAWAPFDLMDREGLRLRFQGGGGQYRYRTSSVAGGWNTVTKSDGELLAGWQFLRGPQALALYGGINVTSDLLAQPDPWNRDQGTHVGAKFLAEWYGRIGERLVATAAAGYSTADRTVTARATIAHRLDGDMEVGTEAATFADEESTEARAGLFLALPWEGRIFRFAGGWRWDDDSEDGPYGTISLFMRY